jgi:ribosomal protein L7Ae-like RNA K-turn-binding protein
MENKRLVEVLGLARRANCLVSGESLWKAIKNNQVNVVVANNLIGNNNRKKLIDKCSFYSIRLLFVDHFEEISKSIGLDNRQMVGVANAGIAKLIEL